MCMGQGGGTHPGASVPQRGPIVIRAGHHRAVVAVQRYVLLHNKISSAGCLWDHSQCHTLGRQTVGLCGGWLRAVRAHGLAPQ